MRSSRRRTWPPGPDAGTTRFCLPPCRQASACRRRPPSALAGAHVEILGKGRKQRVVPLCKPVANVLRAWLDELDAEPDGLVFPSTRGGRLSPDAVAGLLKKHVDVAGGTCASLTQKHVTFHCLRHTTAMDLLHAGIEQTVIALWLGHESIETTQVYLDADLAVREQILAKTTPFDGKPVKFKPDDKLLAFLNQL